jgi:hypothetical protein
MTQVTIPPINITAELQKAALQNTLTADQHADLRTLILDAAAAIGFDGGGRDGLLGYLKFAASTYPKQYMALLSKVLPLQIDSKSTINVIEHVNIVSVPADRYMPPQAFSIGGPIIDNPPQDDSVQTIEDLLKNPTPVDPFSDNNAA